MNDRTVIIDDADKVPPAPPGRHPHAPISGAEFEKYRRHRGLPPAVVMTLAVAALVLAAYVLWRVHTFLDDFFFRYPWIGPAVFWVLAAAFITVIVAGAGAVAARLLGWGLSGAVVRSRLGVPVNVVDVLRTPYLVAEGQALTLELEKARYSQFPNVSTLSNYAPALPPPAAPAPSVVVEQLDEWMGWLDERPHLLLAAETGGGKSVLAGAVLAHRVARRGDRVAILDPHWSPQIRADEGQLVPKWGGISPLAQNHVEIRDALLELRDEYERRLAQLQRGEVVEGEFAPITIVIDEVPEVIRALKATDKRGADLWGSSAVVFGSGGRKVNMRGILLTQSPLVEDIGMNSQMRKNYFRIAMALDECRRLIADEPDKARREALLEALKGRSFPAAVERQGGVWLLNRAGLLDRLPRQIAAARVELAPAPATPPADPRAQAADALRQRLAVRSEAERRAVVAELARQRGETRTGWRWTTDELQHISGLRNQVVCEIAASVRAADELQVAA